MKSLIDADVCALDLPQLSGFFEAGSVIPGTVVSQHEFFDLPQLAIFGQNQDISVPRLDRPIGTKMRIRAHTRDVALSLARPEAMSIVNVLEGRVIHRWATATVRTLMFLSTLIDL